MGGGGVLGMKQNLSQGGLIIHRQGSQDILAREESKNSPGGVTRGSRVLGGIHTEGTRPFREGGGGDKMGHTGVSLVPMN